MNGQGVGFDTHQIVVIKRVDQHWLAKSPHGGAIDYVQKIERNEKL